ncbi:MAG: GntR family transcriptional regulator [Atopobiaceae bacterium]|nr:GntR family transcriptional regulator [Atopobiaceae bacterium]
MRAAYDGIYFELKHLIEDGTYAYQTLLPSETVLVKRFGCAHNTVRKALSVLASDGYVQPIHGKGVRVIYRADFMPAAGQVFMDSSLGIESFVDRARRCGFAPHTNVVLMEYLEVDEELAQIIPFEVGQCLLHVERVRFYNDVPLSWENSYFRGDLVAGITKAHVKKSVYRFIESSDHGRIVTTRRKITVAPANERDYELLDMGDTGFVAITRKASFDNNGMLCEVSEHRQHPSVFMVMQTAQTSRVNEPRRRK